MNVRPLVPASLLLLLLGSVPRDARAQAIGLQNILNPEGSRLFPQSIVYPRHPGKPDPRWRAFDWKFADFDENGAKFRLYYYEDETWAARFAIPRIQDQVKDLIQTFNYTPKDRFDYILFTSRRDFQQANVFFVSEGVQGITSTTEATMAVPYWGDFKTFEHISRHEMVHQFQVQKINTLAGGYIAGSSGMPLWFIEGMAEYYSMGGVDDETRYYIRDVLLHEDKSKGHVMPKFFEDGPLNFIGVYKIGQVKIDFLEKEFGTGTAQFLLEKSAIALQERPEPFVSTVMRTFKLTQEEFEKRWQKYLEAYREDAAKRSQDLKNFEQVEAAGENLDLFDVSPDGRLLLTREVDILSGETQLILIDLRNGRRVEVAEDQKPNLLGLYFFELPTIALSNGHVAYFVKTTRGPELEVRKIRWEGDKFRLGSPVRHKIHAHGLVGANSPTISPDESAIAFVGLDSQGWENVYRLELPLADQTAPPRRLTEGYYSWKHLDWGASGILASSNRTPDATFNIFLLNPESGAITQISQAHDDQLAPDGSASSIVYQSWTSGSSQIHRLIGTQNVRLTDVKTGLSHPKLRGDLLYALGFRQGRYHLYRIPKDQLLRISVPNHIKRDAGPWLASLASFEGKNVESYAPFRSSGVRLDYLSGFFGSGGVGGIVAGTSDLMRNYSLSGEFSVLGDFKYTNAYGFLSSSKGRWSWTTGPYHVAQPRLDTFFSSQDGAVRTYLHREYGALGAFQYPLGAFSYFDIQLRLAGVSREDFSDLTLVEEFEKISPGPELLMAPMVRLGFDRVIYELYTGPLEGYGLLLEADTSYYPKRAEVSERLRLDGSVYFRIWGRTVVALQGMAGIAFGGDFRNPFFLSSDDIMRAYYFGDDRLFGSRLAAMKSELRFPIGSLFKFPPLRGLVSYDLGTVYSMPEDFTRNIASSGSWGLSLNLPPLSLNLLWSYPIRTAPGPVDSPVFHFTLRYLYL